MTTRIWTANGRSKDPIPTILTGLSALEPTWLWYEPRPGCGLDTGANPLTHIAPEQLHPLLRRAKPMPPIAPEIIIDEARLFWPSASLHLLAGAGETQWSYWAVAGNLAEEIREAMANLGLESKDDADHEEGKAEPALTRRDFVRFGLPAATQDLPKYLYIETYRRHGALAAWTITEHGDR